MVNMCSVQLSILPFFYNNSPPPRQFFREKILLKKISSGKCSMLIEQIIEFELKGPGPPGRACAPITG